MTTVLELHQSWLGEYLLCPERARQQWFGEVEDTPTDSTAIGTALHAYAESILRGGYQADARRAALDTWDYESALPGFRMVKVARESTALKHLENACDVWLARVYPNLGNPIAIEHKFDFPFMGFDTDGHGTVAQAKVIEYADVEVRLAGAIDLIDEDGVWDWKSATNMDKYNPAFGGEGWKLKRFGIQPTVYCTALLLDPDSPTGGIDTPVNFTFAAVSKTNRSVQFLPVERGREHVRWLSHLVANVAKMIVTDPEGPWPLNDQHALCAPDWCPSWSSCKGAALAEAAR